MRAEPGHVRACFDAIESAGLTYAVLHGAEDIPDCVDSDVDIVVPEGSMSALTLALADFASSRGGVLCQTIRHESNARYHVLALPDESGAPAFLKVDASTDFRRDGCVFFTSRELLESTTRIRDVMSVSTGVEFAAYLAKRVLKGCIDEPHLVRLRRLWKKDEAECRAQCELLIGLTAAGVVAEAFGSSSTLGVAERLLTLRRFFLRGALTRHPWWALRLLVSVPGRYLRRALNRTGFQVALLGPDGIGKTSLLVCLGPMLAPAFRFVEYVHLRPGALPSRSAAAGRAPIPYGRPVLGYAESVLKLAYLVIDYILGYWGRIWPRLVSSTLVLCDRYYLDIAADPARYRYGGPGWLVRMAAALIPGPDLYVVLMAGSDFIQARKAEVSRSETELQIAGYARLMAGPATAVVDATGPASAVLHEVAWLLLRTMARRAVNRP